MTTGPTLCGDGFPEQIQTANHQFIRGNAVTTDYSLPPRVPYPLDSEADALTEVPSGRGEEETGWSISKDQEGSGRSSLPGSVMEGSHL
jgi:hypothetical protein